MAYIIIDDPSGYAFFYDVPPEVYDYIQELRKELSHNTSQEEEEKHDKTRIQS